MQQVTVGTKYQIVIPKEVRAKLEDLRPGAKVMVSCRGKDSIVIETETKNWAGRMRGITKKAWKGIDTAKYLEGLRNDWDNKT